MVCSVEKLNALQIKEEYKQGLAQFCSIPDNASICAELCAMPPEAIVEAFTQAEVTLGEMAQKGFPQELMEGLSQQIPEMNPADMQIVDERQNFARGGIASMGRYNDDQLAHVQTGEMVVPVKVLRSNPGLRQGIAQALSAEGVNPERFVVGGIGSYNPATGRQEFGFLSSIWKAVKKVAPIALSIVAPSIGTALGSTWSAATWTAIGAGVGTKLAGGSWGDALTAGLVGYGASSYLNPGSTTGNTAKPLWGGTDAASAVASAPSASVAEPVRFRAPAAPTESITSPTLGGGVSATQSQAMLNKPNFLSAGLQTGVSPAAQPAPTYTAPASATPPAPTAPAKIGFFDDPIGWAGQNKLQAALGISGLLGMTGALDAPQPERPEGYSQKDPAQQYGGRAYETLAPEALFGRIGTTGVGSPSSPVGIGPPAPTGPLPAATPVIYGSGAPTVPVAARDTYTASAAPWTTAPSYSDLFKADGGYIDGPGTETSDSIPANLSDGEFVMTAQAVRGAGRGSLREGARRMYAIMDELERRA